MYSIVYVSTANPSLDSQSINEMFERFRTRNDENDICGILMYAEGNFFQVLEVANKHKKRIISLFESIKKDQRHYDIIKILEKQHPSKSFSRYHCSFKTLTKSGNISELYTFLKRQKKYNPEGYERISYLAQKFLTLI